MMTKEEAKALLSLSLKDMTPEQRKQALQAIKILSAITPPTG